MSEKNEFARIEQEARSYADRVAGPLPETSIIVISVGIFFLVGYVPMVGLSFAGVPDDLVEFPLFVTALVTAGAVYAHFKGKERRWYRAWGDYHARFPTIETSEETLRNDK